MEFIYSRGIFPAVVLDYMIVPYIYRHLGSVTGAGDLYILQRELFPWLDEFNYKNPIDSAAEKGHLHIIEWFYKQENPGMRSGLCKAMERAAVYGHLHIVKWFHNNMPDVRCTSWAVDAAAAFGYVDVLEWFHTYRTERCTSDAMDLAAMFGKLDSLNWLFNHGSGCTPNAMIFAASNGHLDVIEWLYAHRAEIEHGERKGSNGRGYVETVIDRATKNGHHHVIEWLRNHNF